MNNLRNKFLAATTTGALLLSSFASIAFADIDVRVSGNGSRSDNEVSINHESSTHISQSNSSDISNILSVSSNTGGNRANDNTGGDVHIESGDSNTRVGVANFANLNYLGINHSGGSDNYNDDSSDYDWDNEYEDSDYSDEKYQNYDKDDYSNDHDYDRNNSDKGKYSKNYEDNENNHNYDKSDYDNDYGKDNYDKLNYDSEDYDSKYAKKNGHKSYGDEYDEQDHDSNYDESDKEHHEDYSGGQDDEYDGGDDGYNDDSDSDYQEYELESTLSGEEEVPGPGDEDATGWAHIRVVPVNSEVCVHMDVDNVFNFTAAHIHKGEEGEAGPPVIYLPTPNEYGQINACMNADKDLLEDIENNPSGYYVNVHNDEYPDGAARGQLY